MVNKATQRHVSIGVRGYNSYISGCGITEHYDRWYKWNPCCRVD